MDKIKWKYDAELKEWWTNETAAYKNDGFSIRRLNANGVYELNREPGPQMNIGFFQKLSSAKTVANLLRHG